MKFAVLVLVAAALSLSALPAQGQKFGDTVPMADSSIAERPRTADTTNPDITVDPGMIIRPDTSITPEMRVFSPPDSVDPDMVYTPEPVTRAGPPDPKLRRPPLRHENEGNENGSH